MSNKPSPKVVANADFYSREKLQEQNFPRGTRLFMQTDEYVGVFTVIEERFEQGTHFRQVSGTGGTVVVDLHYLQREFAAGNIRLEPQNEDDSSGKSDDN